MPDNLRALAAFAITLAAFLMTGPVIEAGVPVWATFTGLAVTIGVNYTLYGPDELRRERRAKGLCQACGYDLTGNASGICPECGQAK